MKRHLRKETCCQVCAGPAVQERTLLDINTAMEVAGLSRATLYRWMQAGWVEWAKLPSGRRRIYLDSLFHDPPRPRDWIA